MMSTPPGRVAVDGPIMSRIRAILTARVANARLGVSRLAFIPTDIELLEESRTNGPRYATIGEDGGGPKPWSNPNRLVSSGARYLLDDTSNELIGRKFKPFIPSAATIIGLTVGVTGYEVDPSFGKVLSVQLKNTSGALSAVRTVFVTGVAPVIYEISGTLAEWTAPTLTPAIVNADDFSARFVVSNFFGAFEVGLLLAFIAVDYTISGAFYRGWREDPETGVYAPAYAGTKVVE